MANSSVRHLSTIADLELGDHLCLLYASEEEHRAVLTPFLRGGLERGEKVVYVAEAHSPEMILGYLRDDGLPLQPTLAREQLVFLTAAEFYLVGEVFDPDRVIGSLQSELALALAQGYSGLRATSEMTWVLSGLPGCERLIEYEARLNERVSRDRSILLCQYDRRRFEPGLLLDVLRTHPLAAVGSELYDNSYYIPPAELLKGDLAAVELNYWVRNLAERRAMELVRRGREDIYRTITENVQDGLTIIEEGKVVYFNDRACEIFGYPRDEYAKMTGLDLAAPEERDRLERIVQEVRRTGIAPEELEFWVVRRDGARRRIRNRYAMLHGEDDLTGRLVVTTDVTERKRAEEALRESEDRYRAVSELTSDLAYAVRIAPDGTLTCEWVTDAFSRITGFTPAEAIARGGWQELIHPEDLSIVHRHIQIRLTGQQDVAEYRIITRSGEVRWMRGYSHPIWDEGEGRVVRVLGAVQDITERKRLEQYVRRTERLAAMGRMAAGLAHEIKNPLQAVHSHLELVLDFPLESGEREEYLRFCQREIEQLTAFTERILRFARPTDATPRPIPVADLMGRALALVGQSLQQAHIELTMSFPSDLPPVLVSPDQIAQVLLNLLVNSIEAVSAGGHISVTARAEGEMVALMLMNDGPPIPPENIEHIFEPFFTTKSEGTGLGLFISHNIVEQHGGTIVVENLRDEQGVIFTIRLPREGSV